MWYYAVKVVISAALIVLVSEIAKRSSVFGALLASLPLVSLLAFVWLYYETGDVRKISRLSLDIFWLVIPSLLLFLILPWLLRRGLTFWPSLLLACAATTMAYGVTLAMVRRFFA
ncbi:MAG TPA: DUF3147 family protein [Gammaproteobacteria bacterium]|nr:DUF3147 family protein [Gammaproteobacteria bacterium]